MAFPHLGSLAPPPASPLSFHENGKCFFVEARRSLFPVLISSLPLLCRGLRQFYLVQGELWAPGEVGRNPGWAVRPGVGGGQLPLVAGPST